MNRSLLANASHELRSPLARLKMALAMLDDATSERRAALKDEIARNIGELDALVEEVLLASRLEARRSGSAAAQERVHEPVDPVALAAEEAARAEALFELPDAGAAAAALPATLRVDERLLRRALRNRPEPPPPRCQPPCASMSGCCAARCAICSRTHAAMAAAAPELQLRRVDARRIEFSVCDRRPGVPEAERERIFEPFSRLPGHAEQAGGVGLGLSLVRQIARHHGGEVRCEPRGGGGSCFVIELPLG